MIKRIGFFIFLFSLVLLIGQVNDLKVSAAAPNQTDTTSTTTFTIRGGNGNDTYDENGNAILKPHQVDKYNIITLKASSNGRTAELPIGTTIFLYFPSGDSNVKINPSKGVVEAPKGKVQLPSGVIGLLEVVGQGNATITVTTKASAFKKTLNAASTFANWSGYAHTSTTTGSYTDITSHWIVPTASSCSSGDTDSSAWTGIDGTGTVNGNPNVTLIQTGTESDCVSGSVFYQAWYEIVPSNPNQETPITSSNCQTSGSSCSVNAGDSMTAEVKQVSGTNWAITITDLTQNPNWTFSTNLTYSGDQSSAEWILERPQIGQDGNGNPIFATLTQYGTASFTNDTQNSANPSHSYSTDSIDMVVSGTNISTTSNPNSLNDAFSVAYGSTQPSAPASMSDVSPSGTTNDLIYSMSASSPSNIWASGYEKQTGYDKQPVTYHNTGSGFTKVSPPSQGLYNEHQLYGIAASSSDAWTVGKLYSYPHYVTLAYRWNGSSWVLKTSDNPSSTQSNVLNGVAVDSSGGVWAVGYYYDGSYDEPLIEKWDGTKLAYQGITTPSGCVNTRLNSVTFSSSTNGWAVGYTNCSSTKYYVIYHYDGAWETPTVGTITTSNLLSVTVAGSDVWAVGSQGSSGTPLIMHYTSGSWTQDTSFNGSYPAYATLYGVSADSSSDVWIGGWWYNSSSQYKPYTMHYNGSWTQVTAPSISGSGILQGMAVNSGTSWAGGYFGALGTSTPTPLAFKSL